MAQGNGVFRAAASLSGWICVLRRSTRRKSGENFLDLAGFILMDPILAPCQRCGFAMDVDALHCPSCGSANNRTRTGTQPLFSQKPKSASEVPQDASESSATPLSTSTTAAQVDPLPPDAATAAAGIDAKSGEHAPLTTTQSTTAASHRTPGVDTTAEPVADEERKVQAGDLLLDQYRVVKQLGEGGMGAVYLAIDDLSKQHVAVKVLPAELAQNTDFRERFQLEAKALASLDHPAIVPLLIFSQRGGERYLVMKYVEGQNVEGLLEERKQLPAQEAREIFRWVVSALDFAHKNGVIHRDVKPANVLRANDGRTFLVDFGIAKQETGTNVTQTGILMGTPQYMSPEQIRGHKIDGRSDLYAAGLLLYEMLCGKPPFTADKTFAVLRAHVEDDVPDPQLFCVETIPDDLRGVLALLLAKNPDERPETGQKVLGYLDGKIAFDGTPAFGIAPNETNTPITTRVLQPNLDDAFLARYDDDDDIVLPKNRAPFYAALLGLMIAILGGAWAFRDDLSKALLQEPVIEKPTSLLDRARTALMKKDGDAAVTLLDVHLLEQVDDIEAICVLGKAKLLQKKRKGARKELKRARSMAKVSEHPEQFAVYIADLNAAIEADVYDQKMRKAAALKAKKEREEADRRAKEKARQALPRNLTNAQLIAVTDSKKARRAKQLCWETIVLRKTPKAKGSVTFAIRIEESGRVTSSKVLRKTVQDKRFVGCLDKVVKSWRFPAFRGGAIELNHVTDFDAN
ncbi:MAG: protein kinase [Deltaproteobacteria bacterium]|nr:protein kinase [Deltaproteobacteria bacterium]